MPPRNDDEFDEFARRLQADVDAEVQRTYSPNAIDLIKHETNMGPLADATVTGTASDEAGKTITVYLKVSGAGIIEQATFETTGCKPSIAAGAQATILARGKHVTAAASIDGAAILRAIGKLPPEYHGYTVLAADALRGALRLHSPR